MYKWRHPERKEIPTVSATDDRDASRPRFYIDKEGNWYQDGLPVLHRRTYLYNISNLKSDGDGRLFVEEGDVRVYVRAEDTPFVVRSVVSREGRLQLVLNDDTVEELDPLHLRFGEDNVPYTTVKEGRFEARFSRPAYYQLASHIVEEGGEYFLEHAGMRYRLGKAGRGGDGSARE